MFKPKIGIAGAAVGFVLSALTGIISGNPFGIVLFRALVLAILFGVIAMVLGLLVIQFLPELSEGLSSGDTAQDNANLVDITVGDQGGDINPFGRSSNGSEGSADGDSPSGEEQIPDFLLSGSHDRPPRQEAADVPLRADESGGEGSPGPAEVRPRGAAPHSGRSAGGLDVLPDLEDFVPARRDTGAEEETSASEAFLGSALSGPVGGSKAETETMAKAIRTILTREP